MTSLRQTIEETILSDPDDLSAQMAYADLLSEEGDPRGEFIQVQIALEVPELASEHYRRLRRRERELLERHERAWLGETVWELLGRAKRQASWYARHWPLLRLRWWRGWVERVEVREMSPNFAAAIATLPATGVLRHLVIQQWAPETAPSVLSALDGAAFLPALRRFQIGAHADTEQHPTEPRRAALGTEQGEIATLVRRMKQLRELDLFVADADVNLLLRAVPASLEIADLCLPGAASLEPVPPDRPLSRLSTLMLSRTGGWNGLAGEVRGWDRFLSPAAFPALKHLHVCGIALGSSGLAALVRSGLLRQLHHLGLRAAGITPDDARLLVAAPEIGNLRSLDLRGNALPAEIGWALQEAGVVDLRLNG